MSSDHTIPPVEDDDSDSSDSGAHQVVKKVPSSTFGQLGLNQWLLDALKGMRIDKPTEIQAACIPAILAGQDCIGGAKTGSGKTAAFALPILQKLSEDPYGVFGVVLTPTRELAVQIDEQFRVLGKGIGLKSVVAVGGLDMMQQAIDLARRPHVIIATPGRLRDHLERGGDTLSLSRVRFLVLDEADRLLSDTFAEDLDAIFSHIPSKRQTLLFTATMTEPVLALQHSSKKPFTYQCDIRVQTVTTLIQYYIFIPSHVREVYLAYMLRESEFSARSTIIFTNRCYTAARITLLLKELGIRCTALHSEMSQQERLDSLGRFRAGVITVLLATDVGSRGLDIPSVQLVINYDVPRDPTDYIHRVGRTARAGKGGVALTIVMENDVELVQKIEDRTNKQMEELKINETKILELLTEVSAAKRVANMALHDTKFGRKKEIRLQKRSSIEENNLQQKKKRRGMKDQESKDNRNDGKKVKLDKEIRNKNK